MPRWRQIDGRLVLVDAGYGGKSPRVPVGVHDRPPADAPAIHGDIEPFVSPIDRRVIGSRRDLREHNLEHNVIQHREFGDGEGAAYLERQQRKRYERLHSQTREDREDRIRALNNAFDKHRS